MKIVRIMSEKYKYTNTGRSPYLVWLIWAVWIPLLIPSMIQFIRSRPSFPLLFIILSGVVLFLGIYLWGGWQTAQKLVATSSLKPVPTLTWLILAILTILSFSLPILAPGVGLQSLFIYTSGYMGGSLPINRAVPAVSLLFLALIPVIGLTHPGLSDISQVVIFIPAVILIVKIVLWSILTSWELRSAREEIAHLAVTAERLRIARDLHDLLGHSLSLIALKSELAQRLVMVTPTRACTEISDIEQIARTTLQEVREAVSGYRQPTLLNELHGAQEILTAAGIIYQYEGNENVSQQFPPAIETVLAWTVRESVTNVIRHTRAHHCTICIAQTSKIVSIQVTNDGVDVLPVSINQAKRMDDTNDKAGHGLRGLAERVKTLDGSFEAGPRENNTFCLAISLPLSSKAFESSFLLS